MQNCCQNILHHFQKLSVQSDYEDLLNIDGIGETQVNSIKVFLNKTNIRVLNELEKVLVVKKAIQNYEDGLLKIKPFSYWKIKWY